MHREGGKLIIGAGPARSLLAILAELAAIDDEFPQIDDPALHRVNEISALSWTKGHRQKVFDVAKGERYFTYIITTRRITSGDELKSGEGSGALIIPLR